MPVTAIYGQGVYGQSNYGVLVSDASTNLIFGQTGTLRPYYTVQGNTTLVFGQFGSGRRIRFLVGSSDLLFNSATILVNFPYPTDFDIPESLYDMTSLNDNLIYIPTTENTMSIYTST